MAPKLFLGRGEGPGALVPSLAVEPLLERLKPDLWVSPPQFSDVCLKSGIIEPTEHLVILLVSWDWQFLVLDRLAKNPAEDFGSLETRQLTTGNLQLQANKGYGQDTAKIRTLRNKAR